MTTWQTHISQLNEDELKLFRSLLVSVLKCRLQEIQPMNWDTVKNEPVPQWQF